jgi:hypothetical protein
MGAGDLRLGLQVSGTQVHVVHPSECPDIGPICAQRDEPPQLHDQRFQIVELRLTGAYAISARWGVELELPVRALSTTIQYRRLDGTPFAPDYENIHHRDETLTGLGDPWLLGRGSLSAGGFQLTGRLGVSIPLGRTHENPFELGDMGLAHQHVQMGTGTVDPVLLLDVDRPLGQRWSVGLHAQGQLVLYDNRHGYRAGHRLGTGVRGRVRLHERVTAWASFDVWNERPERWDGLVLQDGNLGRTDLLLGAGAALRAADMTVSVGVKVPVYTHIIQSGHEAGQLDYPAILDLSVEVAFPRADR